MVAVFPGSQFTGGDAHNNKVYTINNAMFPGVAGVRMTSGRSMLLIGEISTIRFEFH
jgi:hypothetical protein